MPRIVLRLAFDGTRFHGSQRQPGRPTVDGAVLGALDRAGLLEDEPDYRPQGRTDRGVSARDYPVAVGVTCDLATAARTIAGTADGILPWAGAVVEPGFNPRRAATARTYQYLWPLHDGDPELDVAAAAQAFKRFEGTHDVSAFAKVTDGKDPVRTVLSTELSADAKRWRFEVTGLSFLWRQVRRMVGAALLVAQGMLTVDEIEQALDTGELARHHPAPPEGLVLGQVDLPVATEEIPEARSLARERMADGHRALAQRLAALEAVLAPPVDG